SLDHRDLPSFPTRRSSDLVRTRADTIIQEPSQRNLIDQDRASDFGRNQLSEDTGHIAFRRSRMVAAPRINCRLLVGERRSSEARSEEHTSELQSRSELVCR